MKRADRRSIHYIYKITRDDGKFYIGMHSTDNMDDGYFGSGKKITRSIKKHGREKHTKKILEFCDSRETLRNRESELVNEELLLNPLCMNLKNGGLGNSSEDATKLWEDSGFRKKISESQLKSWDNSTRKDNTSKRTRELWKNPEYRQKLDTALRSRTLSEEQKKKRSEAVKRYWASLTPEQKANRKCNFRKGFIK